MAEKNLYLFCLVFPCLEINVQQSVKYDLFQRSLKFQSGSFKVPMSYLLFLRVDVFTNIFKKQESKFVFFFYLFFAVNWNRTLVKWLNLTFENKSEI